MTFNALLKPILFSNKSWLNRISFDLGISSRLLFHTGIKTRETLGRARLGVSFSTKITIFFFLFDISGFSFFYLP